MNAGCKGQDGNQAKRQQGHAAGERRKGHDEIGEPKAKQGGYRMSDRKTPPAWADGACERSEQRFAGDGGGDGHDGSNSAIVSYGLGIAISSYSFSGHLSDP